MTTAVDRAYRDLSPLDVRIQTHRRYSEAADDVEADVLTAAAITAEDTLLDVGPGTGTFLARLSASGHTAPLAALDFSAESVATCARIPGVRAVRGDARHLPFPDAGFDVVTARHMLYHVDDPAEAVREARRVLREGGRFAAVVNREEPYPHFMALLREVLAGHGITRRRSPDEHVHGGNLPALVAAAFAPDTVRVLRRENALLLPGPEPVVAYLASILTLQGVPDDPDLHRAVTADLDEAARARFRTLPDGIWREPKGYVVVTATA
ncbi:class I SAM-dependent methyltransferase [Catenulispora sp. GAS73]|uniref:class I SAM-dependent methyltransferase n=1 Tax=Catenulispora sp. GAS73 TaxID=3156269 RepID=UPI003517DBFF